ncbi:MAG: hypothetical protein K9L74_05705 [Candidatus Izimaplasma sp.]|nr:hypothetical protein [Candidatus Izimaplasma bacterium]
MSLPPIKNVKLTRKVIKQLKNKYKWSSFTMGRAKMTVTPSGGIHSSGKTKETQAISFEIKKGTGYIMISLFEYPKGVTFHAHVSINDMDKKNKSSWFDVVEPVYNEIKEILEEN